MRDLLSIGTSRGCEMIGVGVGLGLSGYRLPNALFSPSQISGLQLWLDASDSTTLLQSSGGSPAISDGDPVGYWGDKSGNGRHATQTDGASKPALKTAIKNGKNTVRTDGANDCLLLGDNFKYQEITVIAVLRVTTTGICVAFSRGGADNYNPALALVYNRSTPNTSASFNSGAGGNQIINLAITQSQFSIFRASADGATVTNITNGVSNTAAQVGALRFNTNTVTIGRIDTSGLFTAADFCEIIIYNKSLGSSDWASLDTYLNKKWGVY